jgi:hypothetical protein
MAKKATKGDAEGMAAIRIWTNELETAMIMRYIGNAPTLKEIKEIVLKARRSIDDIKPAMMSNCGGDWVHLPGCKCDPSV